jgi:hypothetical protein
MLRRITGDGLEARRTVIAMGKREQGFRTPKKLGDDDAGFFAFEFGSLRELAAKEGDEAA